LGDDVIGILCLSNSQKKKADDGDKDPAHGE
jgi:hypothetical protein